MIQCHLCRRQCLIFAADSGGCGSRGQFSRLHMANAASEILLMWWVLNDDRVAYRVSNDSSGVSPLHSTRPSMSEENAYPPLWVPPDLAAR